MSAILTLNAGSSSIKFSLFEAESLQEEARGMVEEIGGPSARLILKGPVENREGAVDAPDHAAAARAILDATAPLLAGRVVAGVGHRVVHGGAERAAPCIVTPEILSELEALAPLAPLHQPFNLAGLRGAAEAFPGAVQVACFDTAFHRAKPLLQDIHALPQPYRDKLRRFGFHGLSYTHIEAELARTEPDLHAGRVIVLHLGNGASACAIHAGRPITTTMGFSALDGLCMGTRPGAIDPGVLLYLMREEGMDAPALERLLYTQSGLMGLSGLSSDMRMLTAADSADARLAVDYFCARVAREIGALAAAMGGLDGIVFTGGIGENAADVRAKALAGLGFLGLTVDPQANADASRDIGTGPVRVLVLPTDEERVIARATARFLAA
jgi:acetate kinase